MEGDHASPLIKDESVVTLSRQWKINGDVYRVIAVLKHTGELAGGHYTTDRLRPDGSWGRYNDSVVSKVSEGSALGDHAATTAYLILVAKVEERVPPILPPPVPAVAAEEKQAPPHPNAAPVDVIAEAGDDMVAAGVAPALAGREPSPALAPAPAPAPAAAPVAAPVPPVQRSDDWSIAYSKGAMQPKDQFRVLIQALHPDFEISDRVLADGGGEDTGMSNHTDLRSVMAVLEVTKPEGIALLVKAANLNHGYLVDLFGEPYCRLYLETLGQQYRTSSVISFLLLSILTCKPVRIKLANTLQWFDSHRRNLARLISGVSPALLKVTKGNATTSWLELPTLHLRDAQSMARSIDVLCNNCFDFLAEYQQDEVGVGEQHHLNPRVPRDQQQIPRSPFISLANGLVVIHPDDIFQEPEEEQKESSSDPDYVPSPDRSDKSSSSRSSSSSSREMHQPDNEELASDADSVESISAVDDDFEEEKDSEVDPVAHAAPHAKKGDPLSIAEYAEAHFQKEPLAAGGFRLRPRGSAYTLGESEEFDQHLSVDKSSFLQHGNHIDVSLCHDIDAVVAVVTPPQLQRLGPGRLSFFTRPNVVMELPTRSSAIKVNFVGPRGGQNLRPLSSLPSMKLGAVDTELGRFNLYVVLHAEEATNKEKLGVVEALYKHLRLHLPKDAHPELKAVAGDLDFGKPAVQPVEIEMSLAVWTKVGLQNALSPLCADSLCCPPLIGHVHIGSTGIICAFTG